jgi:endonuclease/exonuclease/phosphatase family metal-dependent hydrolase
VTRVRIATYNLESLGERPGRPPLAARLAPLRAVLDDLDADVLCLQEIDGEHPAHGVPRRLLSLEALLRGGRYQRHVLVGSHRRPADGEGAADVHNLAILSRFPLIAADERWNRRVPAPDFDRPILHAVVDVHGRRLHVVNLHLRAPLAAPVAGGKQGRLWVSTAAWAEGFYMAGGKRAAQALEARLLVDEILEAEPDAGIAVGGDLNCEPRDIPFRLLRAAVDDTGNPALADRALVAVADRVPAARRFSVVHAGAPRLVDHLLVSRALAAGLRAAAIRNDALPDEASASPEAVTASTHAPVVAELDLD